MTPGAWIMAYVFYHWRVFACTIGTTAWVVLGIYLVDDPISPFGCFLLISLTAAVGFCAGMALQTNHNDEWEAFKGGGSGKLRKR